MDQERIILGIDPGTNIMGYGVIACKGGKVRLIALDVVKMAGSADQHAKLKRIFETTLQLIDLHSPTQLSIESTFFGKNVQSMLKLGRAQGVAIAAALYRGLEVFEYSPRRIKQSITGRGNASKDQVAAMLSRLLEINLLSSGFDATDGLAVAMCHVFQKDTNAQMPKSHNSWKSFIAENPNRMG
ncbi:MAG: crossover junction endodeoxyribonuclease RuvC [Bacteroidales bacterium]|nr:crossover junction endodeoxyribonuclease RuvC [Bacteroidales bacterium]MDZ4204379.1 crossover junction endodeoxyribonuclease RuvC [Bacteroidales bacterium]